MHNTQPIKWDGTRSKRNFAKKWKPLNNPKSPDIQKAHIIDRGTGEIKEITLRCDGRYGIVDLRMGGRGTPPFVLKVGTTNTRGKASNHRRKRIDSRNLCHRTSNFEMKYAEKRRARGDSLYFQKIIEQRRELHIKGLWRKLNIVDEMKFRSLDNFLKKNLDKDAYRTLIVEKDRQRERCVNGQKGKKNIKKKK